MSGISKTTFLLRSKKVHGDAYDYSDVEIDPTILVRNHPQVKIKCKKHNYIFYEHPARHYDFKRYSYRKSAKRRPVCCQRGNDLIFFHGGFSAFLDKVEKLGRTMTYPQLSLELGYINSLPDPLYNFRQQVPQHYAKLYKDIIKSQKKTGRRKPEVKKAYHSLSAKYQGRSGLIKTRDGLSIFNNGTEMKRECKSCHSMLELDKFHTRDASSEGRLQRRRECKKCWMKNKVQPWKKEKMKTDPIFKLSCTLRCGVYSAIRTCKKNGVDTVKLDKTLNLLGAQSWRDVFNHFESLFAPGMTWQNHGLGNKEKKEWHIDHIKPVDYFIKNKDFTLLEVQKECFNLLNLQPLWAKDNLSKSNRISEKDF